MCACLAATSALAWSPARDSEGRALRRPEGAAPVPIVDAGPSWTLAALAWSAATRAAFAPGAVSPAVDAPDPRDGLTSLHRVSDAATWRAWVGDPEVVAFTLWTADGEGEPRVLRDADVLVNDAAWRISAAGDRDALDEVHVLGHELGHVLGLGHTCDDDAPAPCDAFMVPVVAPGPGVQAPGADDVAGGDAWLPSTEVQRVLPGPWRRGVGVWRCSLEGAARWRPWRGGDEGDATVGAPFVEAMELAPDTMTVEVTDDSKFLWAEVWSSTGHGLRLIAPEAEVEPAMDAAVGGTDAADAAPTSAPAARASPQGCGAVPWSPSGDALGPSLCALVGAALSRRRRSVLR
jgi:hypothetical protein